MPLYEFAETEEHDPRGGLFTWQAWSNPGFSLADRRGLTADPEVWLVGAEVGGCVL